MISLTPSSAKDFIIPYIATFVGSLLVSIAVNAFFIPHHLLSSGISGVAIILYYIFHIPIGVAIFLLNIPIMIACYRFMGRSYAIVSVVGMAMLSVIVDATAFLSSLHIIHDPMTSCIAGGILSGIGFGIIYKYDGNSGGLDVIGAIVKKFYSLEMGTVIMLINSAILLWAAYLFSLEKSILTFVSIYITAVITNKVVLGTKHRKAVIIISKNPEKIAQLMIHYVGRGVTFFHGEGVYTGQEKQVIYSVIKLTEIPKVKAIIDRVDPQALMTISDASEVVGPGFTMPVPPAPTKHID